MIRVKYFQNEKEPPREVLSIDETAEFLGLSRNTVTRQIKEGGIPSGKIGRRYFVHKSTLIQMIGGNLEN